VPTDEPGAGGRRIWAGYIDVEQSNADVLFRVEGDRVHGIGLVYHRSELRLPSLADPLGCTILNGAERVPRRRRRVCVLVAAAAALALSRAAWLGCLPPLVCHAYDPSSVGLTGFRTNTYFDIINIFHVSQWQSRLITTIVALEDEQRFAGFPAVIHLAAEADLLPQVSLHVTNTLNSSL
jgi:hypothetical protein